MSLDKDQNLSHVQGAVLIVVTLSYWELSLLPARYWRQWGILVLAAQWHAGRQSQWEGNGRNFLQTTELLRCLKKEHGGFCLCLPLKKKRFYSFLVVYPEEITEYQNFKHA